MSSNILAHKQTAFQFIIRLPTGHPTAAKAVEWGLKRLQRSAPYSKKHYVTRKYRIGARAFTQATAFKAVRFFSLSYKFIARNMIQVRLVSTVPITFRELKNIIREEIKGPFIEAIYEETPMVMF